MNPGRRPLDAALTYADRGWPVFPTHTATPRRDARCSCGRPDCASVAKHPRTRNGLKDATTDPDTIRDWWSYWPDAGVAIRTGAPSRLLVIDIDVDHGGEHTLADLVNRHGPLPNGRTVRTGGGGRHLYFRHPGRDVANTAGRLGPGIDTRGDGGYVLAPPSRHRTGGTYLLTGPPNEIPDPPSWLLAALERPPPTQASEPVRPPRDIQGMGPRCARRRAPDPRRRPGRDPQRHPEPGLVPSRADHRRGGPRRDGDRTLLIDRGIAAGLRQREAATTVQSGLHAGEAHPRVPHDGPDLSPGP